VRLVRAWARLREWAMRWRRDEPREGTSAVEYDRKMRLMEHRLDELGAAVDVMQATQEPHLILPHEPPAEDTRE
jgi:hypothetical protein